MVRRWHWLKVQDASFKGISMVVMLLFCSTKMTAVSLGDCDFGVYFNAIQRIKLQIGGQRICRMSIYTGAPYSSCERKGNPWVDFLMVIMASSIARGRVRTTTTTTAAELPNMAAILQKRHTALVYRVLLWYWTSMLWPINVCQNKVSADQYHMTISWAQPYSSSRSHVLVKLTADQVQVFWLDRGLMSG